MRASAGTDTIAILSYSATGTLQAMAERLEQASVAAGAEVRRRHVRKNAPAEAIASNPAWAAHVEATTDEPTAGVDAWCGRTSSCSGRPRATAP